MNSIFFSGQGGKVTKIKELNKKTALKTTILSNEIWLSKTEKSN